LEASLRKFAGTLVFVSHDRYFINRMADHMLVWESDRWRVIEGNYDTYHALAETWHKRDGGCMTSESGSGPVAKSAVGKKENSKTSADKSPQAGGRPKRHFPYRKVADIEADIFDHEKRLAELHQQFAEPDTHRDGERVRAIQREVGDVQKSLAELYEHWEEAMELN
jgi:ATP-binding cassette subfamily F protein 3